MRIDEIRQIPAEVWSFADVNPYRAFFGELTWSRLQLMERIWHRLAIVPGISPVEIAEGYSYGPDPAWKSGLLRSMWAEAALAVENDMPVNQLSVSYDEWRVAQRVCRALIVLWFGAEALLR